MHGHISWTSLEEGLKTRKNSVGAELKVFIFLHTRVPASPHAFCEHAVANVFRNILEIQIFYVKIEQDVE